jgi:hypothetical protein
MLGSMDEVRTPTETEIRSAIKRARETLLARTAYHGDEPVMLSPTEACQILVSLVWCDELIKARSN